MANKFVEKRIAEKRDTVYLLRERDERALKDPDEMLETELDKEIEWRENPNRFETTDSIIKSIHAILLKMEKNDAERLKILHESQKQRSETELEESN